MLKHRQIGRSVVLNWLALAFSLGIAFFLSPFVVHRLGNVTYGLWTLVNSMISYMGILDLGLRGTITRFVSRYYARQEHEDSSKVVSAALWLRLCMGFAIVVISLALPKVAVSVFHIPAELQWAANWAIVVTGISFGVTLTFGVFGGVLAALQRFDLLSGVNITQSVLRAIGTLWLLSSGHGIVSLALWELAVVGIANTLLTFLCFRVYRQLRLFFRRPDFSTLRLLGGYSFYILIINLSIQVVYYSDSLVVGAFLSTAAVTFYAIAGGLFQYTRQIVGALGITVFPLASSLDAVGKKAELRRLLINGTQAVLLVVLPIQAVLFFRGHTFIGLWMGPQYGDISGRVLQILLIAQVLALANYTATNIAGALGRHQPVAYALSIESVINIAVSVFLVRQIGLNGVAWGTAIPAFFVNVLFWPVYVRKITDIPIWEYIQQAWIRAGMAVAPFAVCCFLADRFWTPTKMMHFIGQTLILLPIFVLGAMISFRKEISEYLVSRPKWSDSKFGYALQFLKRAD